MRLSQQQQHQQQIQDLAGQQQQVVYLNWSNFKPELSGKPGEDADVHLLCSNDWMISHHFVDGVKVQWFSLTLLGEARLWYHSLEPINVDWPELQNLSRQRYSKVGNTWEQLFHAWRSFNFDENTGTIDTYVTQIRQVATLLCTYVKKLKHISQIDEYKWIHVIGIYHMKNKAKYHL